MKKSILCFLLACALALTLGSCYTVDPGTGERLDTGRPSVPSVPSAPSAAQTDPVDTGTGTSFFGGEEFITAMQYPPFKDEQSILDDIIGTQTMQGLLDPTGGEDPSALYTVTSLGVLDSQEQNGRTNLTAEFHAESGYAVCDYQLAVVYARGSDNKFELVDVQPFGHYYYSVRAMPSDELFDRFAREAGLRDCTVQEISDIKETAYGECSVEYTVLSYGTDGGENSTWSFIASFQDGAWAFHDSSVNLIDPSTSTTPAPSVGGEPETGSVSQAPDTEPGAVTEPGTQTAPVPAVRTDGELLADISGNAQANLLMSPAGERDPKAVFTFTGVSDVLHETTSRSDTVWLTVSGRSAYAEGELDLKLTYGTDSGSGAYSLNSIEATSYPRYTVTAPPPDEMLNAFYVKNLKEVGTDLVSASFAAAPEADNTYTATFVLSRDSGSYETTTETSTYACQFVLGAWEFEDEPSAPPTVSHEYDIPEVTSADLQDFVAGLFPEPLRDVTVTVGTIEKSPDEQFRVTATGCKVTPNGTSKFDFSGFSLDIILDFNVRSGTWQAVSATFPDDIPAVSPKEYLTPFSVDLGYKNMYVTIAGLRYHEGTNMFQFRVIMRREGEEGREYMMECGAMGTAFNAGAPSFLRNIDIQPPCYIYLSSDMIPVSYDSENGSLR